MKKFHVLLFLIVFLNSANATHIIGGYMHAAWLSATSTSSTFKLQANIFRDRSKDGTKDEVPFDPDILVCIYTADGTLQTSVRLPLTYQKHNDGDMSACAKTGWALVDSGIYSGNITLPNSVKAYKLVWERCCRNLMTNLKTNTSGTPYMGMTIECTIAPSDLKNSNPVLTRSPIKVMCQFDTSSFVNLMKDPDNDSLSYRFVVPRQGASTGIPIISNCVDNSVSQPAVDYKTGFNERKLFGDSSLVWIDSLTGTTKYHSNKEGIFAVAIEVAEWRNGAKIAATIIDGIICVKDRSNPPWYLQVKSVKNVFSLFPNPAQDIFIIKTNNADPYYFEIRDISGKVATTGNGSGSSEVNVSRFQNGIYFIRIKQGGILRNIPLRIIR